MSRPEDSWQHTSLASASVVVLSPLLWVPEELIGINYIFYSYHIYNTKAERHVGMPDVGMPVRQPEVIHHSVSLLLSS